MFNLVTINSGIETNNIAISNIAATFIQNNQNRVAIDSQVSYFIVKQAGNTKNLKKE